MITFTLNQALKSGFLETPYGFQDEFFHFCKRNTIGILIGIALNLYIPVGRIAILTILTLQICEHDSTFFFFFLESSGYHFNRGFLKVVMPAELKDLNP